MRVDAQSTIYNENSSVGGQIELAAGNTHDINNEATLNMGRTRRVPSIEGAEDYIVLFL